MNSTERCRCYRRRILEISQQVTAVHVAPAFSCVEIVDALYNEIMRPQDIFIMSKGHGCLAQYVILEELGLLSREDMDLYCKPGGRLGAHPDYAPELGIHASTGSLGHGLGIATGQAMAEKIKGSDVTVYCLLSDGELQEGSSWEAMMMAANLGLTNLVALVDNNDFGGLDRMSDRHPAFYPLVDKAIAFGWEAVEADGHDSLSLATGIPMLRSEQPLFVACRTVKGKGVSYMEHNPIFHYRSPTQEEYNQALAEID